MHTMNTSDLDAREMIRLGVIGPGRAATRFAQGLAGVDGAVLSAVWGRSAERMHAFAERFAVPFAAPTLEEFLASPIDAVYISTHPDSHAELACAALTAGKHVLCEKPSALNMAQVERIFETARAHNRLFMEAMKPPFFPLYQRLRAHLATDTVGPVGFVRAGHCDSSRAPDYPLHFPELGGGGIMGIGPYEAFLALDWLGPLVRMQTMGRVSAAGVDTFALFQTEHERGMAQLHTGLDLLSRGDAMLCGPQGYVIIHENWWNPVRATIVYTTGRTVELAEPYEHGGFNYETAHFCQLIREGCTESPEISYALTLGMADLLQRARTALGVRFPGE